MRSDTLLREEAEAGRQCPPTLAEGSEPLIISPMISPMTLLLLHGRLRPPSVSSAIKLWRGVLLQEGYPFFRELDAATLSPAPATTAAHRSLM